MYKPESIRFEPSALGFYEQVSALRHVAGAYMLTRGGTPLHLSWSANLERRLKRLLLPSHPDSGRPLTTGFDSIECWLTGSRLEQAIVLYGLAKQLYPETYLKFLKLRMPWFLGLTAHDNFPRLEIVNRPARRRFGTLWGPFASRGAAQQYEGEILGLFQLRRCTEALAPHPDHPGCIYGEMNQCLRPCQQAVSTAEYAAETARVRDFLQTNGRASVALLSAARERACLDVEFEQAALIHKRIDKVQAAAALRDPVVGNLAEFNGVALTRSVGRAQFTLWPMLRGIWQPPVLLSSLDNGYRAKSLDSEIRELLAERVSRAASDGNSAEHIAVFSRWYYSSWRDGEWFRFSTLADLNYRKLVRGLSKMAQAAPVSTR